MELSKAFGTINHHLFLSKLKAYGFTEISVSFIRSYHRYQRTKIGSTFSDWNKIISGAPQGSILGPLFFKSFINDLFLSAKKSEIGNYAHNKTLYSANKFISQIIKDFSNDFEILTKWFYDNYMVLDPDKCRFMTLVFKCKTLTSILKM